MNKQECNFTTAVSEHLNKRPTSHDELRYGAGNTNSKTHWCESVRQEHEKGYTFWVSCDPYHEICDGGGIPDKKLKHYWKSTNDDDPIGVEWEGLSCTNWVRARYGKVNDITKERILQNFWDNMLGGQTREKTITEEQEDPEKCRKSKTRAIIGAMINKLPEEWFSGVSKDKDDLEGIIDYLEPTLYDGFINHNDKAYKQRRNKLLGMPYTKPPPILKEEAEITRYNLGAGEKIFPIQKGDIGVNQFTSGKKTYAPNGLHVTPISTNVIEETTLGRTKNIGKVVTMINEQIKNLSFDNWVKVAFRKNAEAKRKISRPARPIIMW
ncbi:hypothetical protein Tco_1311129 [Tanacetum coccineum]